MQIRDIVGDEEWLNGEITTVSNIGSNCIVALTWGSKKKERKICDSYTLGVFASNNVTPCFLTFWG
jgi:hypothetical protein